MTLCTIANINSILEINNLNKKNSRRFLGSDRVKAFSERNYKISVTIIYVGVG
jgi:hypothetical protein